MSQATAGKDLFHSKTELPRYSGYIVFDPQYDTIDTDFEIYPTIDAAIQDVQQWRYDDDNDDYIICRFDSPLAAVAEVLGRSSRDEFKEQNETTPLFPDSP